MARIAFSAADYLTQLKALLPCGLVWTRMVGGRMHQLLSGLAGEFARVDQRLIDLREEADPRTAVELLPEWERLAGLPDACDVQADSSIGYRRAVLIAKLLATGGASRPYFLGLAAALGYPDATIDDRFRPLTCNSNCNDSLWSVADRFVWKINLPGDGGIFPMNCNDSCNDYLRVVIGDFAIECRISKVAPAHTVLLFEYVD